MNKDHRDPEYPWNPLNPMDLSPVEFERQVLHWLEASAPADVELSFHHQGVVSGDGGQYSIDILVTQTIFGGAVVHFLVECKHHERPIERDEILILEGKLRDAGAHKGMLFSTSGFQEGAIRLAASRGIATITVIRGAWLYETKAIGSASAPFPWVDLPAVAGVCVSPSSTGISSESVLPDHLDPIIELLQAESPERAWTLHRKGQA